MTTQYKYLTKEDIIQEGDEYKIRSILNVWKPASRVGEKAIDGHYRRPIPAETKQYRDVKLGEVLQEGDEFKSCIDGWVPSQNAGMKSLSNSSYRRPIPAKTKQYRDVKVGEVLQEGDEFLSTGDEWVCVDWAIGVTLDNPGFKVRRPIPTETKQKDCGSITEAQREIIDSERDKRNSAVIAENQQREENEALKTHLKNALSDKVIAIAELTETISEHRMTIRRLTDKLESATATHVAYEGFTRHVAQALGLSGKYSFQDVEGKVQSLTFQNASLDRQLKDALAYKAIAKAELDKVRNAVKNVDKWL